MQFSKRVHLFSSNGRWLREVSGERARGLVRDSGAIPHSKRNGTVCEIQLREIAKPVSTPTPITISSYMGQRYARKVSCAEGEGRYFDFRYIHPDDREIFCLSVADNLSEKVRCHECGNSFAASAKHVCYSASEVTA